MTKIYLTRHGETEWNRQQRFQGYKDSSLTENGILGAELLANRIEDIELDHIISSPLMRAYKTAEIVKGSKDLEIITHNGFKEINLGDFEGLSYEEIEKEYGHLLDKVKKDPFNNSYPNGENMKEFYNRVVKTFKETIEKYKNKTTLIVAHGGTIKCIEAYIRKFELENDWMGHVVKNCSLSYIEINENNEIKEIFYNDTKHLEGSPAFS